MFADAGIAGSILASRASQNAVPGALYRFYKRVTNPRVTQCSLKFWWRLFFMVESPLEVQDQSSKASW